jgi:23S rRNA pseudouridine1911/1915/1917 synthase
MKWSRIGVPVRLVMGAPAMKFTVLYEDNHVLAVSKPTGLATMGTSSGTATLVTLAKDYIKTRYGKPGNVYLGVVSRLDSLATGVVILARTSKAAARLAEQFRTGSVRKRYLVVLERRPAAACADCRDWVDKDESAHRMRCVPPGTPGAKEATLRYRVLEQLRNGAALVEVELESGRKHQIRLQFSERGCPVFGDRKYGARHVWAGGIALHSWQLECEHPVRRTRLSLQALPPRSWQEFQLATHLDAVGDW